MSNLGFVDAIAAAAIGVHAGPIKLERGLPGPKGYGEAHVESNDNRMKQLRGLGYFNVISFVKDVASNWTKIRAGDDGRLILIHSKAGFDLRIIVEWKHKDDGSYWNVITALPYRVARGSFLYEKP